MPSKSQHSKPPLTESLCRMRAEQCERDAERANAAELKVIFRDLARAWRSAADDIANNRPLPSPRRRGNRENDEVA